MGIRAILQQNKSNALDTDVSDAKRKFKSTSGVSNGSILFTHDLSCLYLTSPLKGVRAPGHWTQTALSDAKRRQKLRQTFHMQWIKIKMTKVELTKIINIKEKSRYKGSSRYT